MARFLFAAILLIANGSVLAQQQAAATVELEPDTVLVERGGASITLRDFEAYLATVPEEHRRAVANDPRRLARILDNLLKNRLIAQQAREHGVDTEPAVAARLEFARDQVLARTQMERVAREAETPDFDQQARELYLTRKDELATPKKVSVTHVLIGTDERSNAEALELAEEVAGIARSGEKPFGELVEQYSDDPSADRNDGQFTFARGGEMVKPFEDAAFALDSPGEISEPVETKFGYHVIRLEKVHPPRTPSFEEAKPQLMSKIREQHESRVRQEYVNDLLERNELKAEREIIAALRERYRRENSDQTASDGE